uniref:Actin filament-associated protein 1 n=1 Tax=Lynx canadensis TaxID=61383 RepID=A0A667GYA5_LYNCA
MEELIVELRLFLELLDHEYLTSTVREKKAVITDILLRIQSSKGFEVKDHVQKQETPNSLPAPPQMPLPEIPQPWLPPDGGPPPLPTSSLPEAYYEEAVPLSPGKAPEYITSNYDSDAMSSSYESYDEEEEDGKGKKTRHQWPSEEASMDLVKDAKICAFLLRKKRFGQWSKLLCVIKDTKLLCYKSSKDQQPQMELPLQGCSVTYIPKDSKKKKHELKIAQQGTDPLVLAVQSKEQAEQWLKVIREVYSGCSGPADSEGPPPSSSPVHKTELEKKLSSERPSSDGEGATENGITVCNGKEQVKRKKSSKSETKGTVSKVTGKKITKIIGLGKKKPSTDEQTSSAEEDVPTCGYLNVLSNSRWRERWCRVKDNKLIFHKDRTDLKTHIVSIPLRGCDVIPGLDSKHPLTFRLLRNGQEVAVLEASSSEDMGRWIGILLAETGSSTDPGALHYDYIDVETSANVIQTAKQTFCFMNRRGVSTNPYLGSTSNGYAHPSGTALHYDDVPCINGSVSAPLVRGSGLGCVRGGAARGTAPQIGQNRAQARFSGSRRDMLPRRSGRTSDSRRLPPWWPWSTRDARPLVQSSLSARRNAVQVLSDSSAWPQAGRLGSQYFVSCTQQADLIGKLLPHLHILCRTEQPSLSTLPGPGPVPSSGPPGERPSRNHLTVGPPVLGGLKVGIASGYVSKFGIECVYCWFFKSWKVFWTFFLLFCSPVLFSVLGWTSPISPLFCVVIESTPAQGRHREITAFSREVRGSGKDSWSSEVEAN